MSKTSSAFGNLLPGLSKALRAFQSSGSKFTVVHSLNSQPATTPKTLLILDSSFNPPTKAHLAIALSALQPPALAKHPSPHRLLLLLSTSNADKPPQPASFETRLALMALLARDLQTTLQVDIGLTTEPFYTAKSAAIEAAGNFPGARHVHLMGYDTVTRLLAPKYYPEHTPPLAALEPFFGAGHGARVMLRPQEGYGSVEEQRAFFDGLAEGELEEQGGKREWAGQIEAVEAGEGTGISSTLVRAAAKEGRWDDVEQLTSSSVAEAVRGENIYDGDN